MPLFHPTLSTGRIPTGWLPVVHNASYARRSERRHRPGDDVELTNAGQVMTIDPKRDGSLIVRLVQAGEVVDLRTRKSKGKIRR